VRDPPSMSLSAILYLHARQVPMTAPFKEATGSNLQATILATTRRGPRRGLMRGPRTPSDVYMGLSSWTKRLQRV
jgi:hypothetical protein